MESRPDHSGRLPDGPALASVTGLARRYHSTPGGPERQGTCCTRGCASGEIPPVPWGAPSPLLATPLSRTRPVRASQSYSQQRRHRHDHDAKSARATCRGSPPLLPCGCNTKSGRAVSRRCATGPCTAVGARESLRFDSSALRTLISFREEGERCPSPLCR